MTITLRKRDAAMSKFEVRQAKLVSPDATVMYPWLFGARQDG